MKHNKCGTEYLVRPNDFLSGYRCPKCYKSICKTTEEFKKEVEKISNNEYTILSEYKNNKANIIFKHLKCGTTFESTPHYFLNYGKICPECKQNKKLNTEIFKKRVFDAVKDEYTVLGEYVNSTTKILMKHNKCGNEYLVTPDKFYIGERRCPFCKASKGEEKIRKFLKENNIIFSEQYRFKECCDKKPLPFDFYLNDKNILIEFDGEQHFRSSFGPKSYESTTKHDKIKDAFCKNNNIKLIRIKYDKIDHIEKILINELNLINK